MVLTKVCGTTTVDDALHAATHGAWAVGMVFHRPSPRSVRPADAEAIGAALHPTRTRVAGVFVDEPLDRVVRLAARAQLDLVQLHGDEGTRYAEEVRRRTGAKVVKAARVATKGDVLALDAFRDVDFHLVDARVEGLNGGTGQRVDTRLLAGRLSKVPLFLSGGLDADNVTEAIASVRRLAGVDAASGLESEPGRKDPAKVEAFLAAVHEVNARLREQREEREREAAQREGAVPS